MEEEEREQTMINTIESFCKTTLITPEIEALVQLNRNTVARFHFNEFFKETKDFISNPDNYKWIMSYCSIWNPREKEWERIYEMGQIRGETIIALKNPPQKEKKSGWMELSIENGFMKDVHNTGLLCSEVAVAYTDIGLVMTENNGRIKAFGGWYYENLANKNINNGWTCSLITPGDTPLVPTKVRFWVEE